MSQMCKLLSQSGPPSPDYPLLAASEASRCAAGVVFCGVLVLAGVFGLLSMMPRLLLRQASSESVPDAVACVARRFSELGLALSSQLCPSDDAL